MNHKGTFTILCPIFFFIIKDTCIFWILIYVRLTKLNSDRGVIFRILCKIFIRYISILIVCMIELQPLKCFCNSIPPNKEWCALKIFLCWPIVGPVNKMARTSSISSTGGGRARYNLGMGAWKATT